VSATGLLAGRVAIVTGAGSGIGWASAIRFASEGAAVLAADVRGAKAQACADEINRTGGTSVALEVDVADAAAIQAMVLAAADTFGRLDIVFNNAATTRIGTVLELSAQDWELIWNTNVSAVFFAAKYAVPIMAAQGRGTIISTASVSGLLADTAQVAYTASKAAVISLTRSLAVDHAAQGIRANCICPGMTATPALLHGLRADPQLASLGPAVPPMGRLADPAEIAAAAVWLASDESSYVNGQALVVDGALTAQSHFGLISRIARS
jgi:NAD(P)-dependent dehydrogenase (short-subunit alcohol dehydrogenase family)